MQEIRLIATDIDGTLVKDSAPSIYPEMIELIKKLTDKGYIFFVASGRAYHSIKAMFSEVSDRIGYIAENGAHIIYQGKDLLVKKMEREYVEGIFWDIQQYTDTCDYVVSTTEGSLMDTGNEEFITLIRDGYRNKFRMTENILGEKEPIIKMALFCKGSIRELAERDIIPKWQDKVKCCMAGEEWVDFMDKSVDKGNALRWIQEYLDIPKEATMAFGDNNNDVGLISQAGESYAVENAVAEVKKAAKHICPSYNDRGVYKVLNQLV